MGFCLFNNVAVAARYAQQKYPEIERSRSSIGMCITATARREFSTPIRRSISSRRISIRGIRALARVARRELDAGLGYTLNLPLRAATPAVEQKRGFEAALEEMSASFSPDLIIISAGFDSHLGDPLGQLLLTDQDFVDMTRAVEAVGGQQLSGSSRFLSRRWLQPRDTRRNSARSRRGTGTR